MITSFRTLLTLSVAHGYYSGGCRDFEFIVPAETAALLKNGKLLARMLDGSLNLLYETDNGGDALVQLAGARLRFGIRLLNPLFSNFTELAVPTPLYRNSAAVGSLDPAMATTMTGRILSHVFTKTDQQATVTVNDANGQPLHPDKITMANDRSTVSVDLSGQAAGLYSLVENYPAETRTISYYSDPELLQAGVFGAVEIKIDNGFYSSKPTFTLSFNAKQETLKYYLVVSNYSANEFNHLAVADNGFSEEGRPQINFTKVPAASFTSHEIPPGTIAKAGDRVVLFKTQTTVARREIARKKIQLSRSGDVLIKHLPQPGADKTSGDVVIHISKP